MRFAVDDFEEQIELIAFHRVVDHDRDADSAKGESMMVWLVLSWLVTSIAIFSIASFDPSFMGNRAPRFILGMLLGPLLGLVAGSLVFLSNHPNGFVFTDGLVFSRLVVAYTYVGIVSPMAYSGAVALGCPFIMLARRMNLRAIWWYIPAGCVIGVLTEMVWINLLFRHPEHGLQVFSYGVLRPAVCGGVAMAVFWLIAEWGCPSRCLARGQS